MADILLILLAMALFSGLVMYVSLCDRIVTAGQSAARSHWSTSSPTDPAVPLPDTADAAAAAPGADR